MFDQESSSSSPVRVVGGTPKFSSNKTTTTRTTTRTTRTTTTNSAIASRYLNSLSASSSSSSYRRDRHGMSMLPSVSSVMSTRTATTTEQSYPERRHTRGRTTNSATTARTTATTWIPTTTSTTMNTKLNESNNTSSGMTATTAALDISESWSSSRGTPSRSEIRSMGGTTRGGETTTTTTPPTHGQYHHHYHHHHHHRHSPDHHHHQDTFTVDASDRPLGIEEDCSSIDSPISSNSSPLLPPPSHHILLMDDEHDDLLLREEPPSGGDSSSRDLSRYSRNSPRNPTNEKTSVPTPTTTNTTASITSDTNTKDTTRSGSSPSNRLRRAREHSAKRQSHSTTRTNRTSPQNIIGNSMSDDKQQNRSTKILDFFPKTSPSSRRSTATTTSTTSPSLSSDPSRRAVGEGGQGGANESFLRLRGIKQQETQPNNRNRNRSRWESKQYAEIQDDNNDRYNNNNNHNNSNEEEDVDEAGAPTEIMNNRTSDYSPVSKMLTMMRGRRRRSSPPSESGKSTDIVTNRAVDRMITRMMRGPTDTPKTITPTATATTTPTTQDTLLQEPPSVKRFSGTQNESSTQAQPHHASLFDAMSTNDESSAWSLEKKYSRPLFDPHSPTFSSSTNNSSIRGGQTMGINLPPVPISHEGRRNVAPPRESTNSDLRLVASSLWHRNKDTGNTRGFGMSNVDGWTPHQSGPQATRSKVMPPRVPRPLDAVHQEHGASNPLWFLMPEEKDIPTCPRTELETSMDELVSCVLGPDKPGKTDKHMKRKASRRGNPRRNANAQCNEDDSSDASTISTLDKDHEADYNCFDEVIQPIFSLDRFDFSKLELPVSSNFRKHQRSKSQGAESIFTTIKSSRPSSLKSKSFDGTMSTNGILVGKGKQDMIPIEDAPSRGSRNSADRFTVMRDRPDPVFCSDGSVSFSSQGIGTSVIAASNDDGDDVIKSRSSTRGWAAITRSESDGTGYDTEIMQITNTTDASFSNDSVGRTNLPTPQRIGTVRQKIQAFQRIPHQWTSPGETLAAITPQSIEAEEKKHDSSISERDPIDGNVDDLLTWRNRKMNFESHPVSTNAELSEKDDSEQFQEDRWGKERFREPFHDNRRLDSTQEENKVIDPSFSSLHEKFKEELPMRYPHPNGTRDVEDGTIRRIQKKIGEGEEGHRQHSQPRLVQKTDDGGGFRSLQKQFEEQTRKWKPNQSRKDDTGSRFVNTFAKNSPEKPTRWQTLHHNIVDQSDSSLPRGPRDHDGDEDDDRSVSNLKKRYEAGFKRLPPPIESVEDYSDDRSVKSLKKKFEEAAMQVHRTYDDNKNEDDDRSVSSLKKKFERANTKGHVGHGGGDDPDDRSVSSLKKKFESESLKRRPGQQVNNLRSVFESKMVAHGKRSVRNSWSKPIPARNQAVGLDTQRLIPPKSNNSVGVPPSGLYQKRSQQPNVYSTFDRSAKTPNTVHQERPSGTGVTSDACVDRGNESPTTTNSICDRDDLDTLSTSSSKVRGPMPTSFLQTRDRLLRFAKAEPEPVEALPAEPVRKPAPPSMHQRLNRWALRYQAQSRVSQDEHSPDPVPKVKVVVQEAVPYDRSSLAELERKIIDSRSLSPIAGRSDSLDRPPELNIVRNDSSSTVNAHFMLENDVSSSQPEQTATSDDASDSDGVTLDASIAEVSILTDPTIVRSKESRGKQTLDDKMTGRVFSASSGPVSLTLTQSTALSHPSMEAEDPIRWLANVTRSSSSSSTRETDQAAELHSPKGATTTMPNSHQDAQIQEIDSGWDIEKVSKSFSYDATPERSFMTSEGSCFFDSDVWQSLDDDRWFDFSVDKVEKNSILDFEGDERANRAQGKGVTPDDRGPSYLPFKLVDDGDHGPYSEIEGDESLLDLHSFDTESADVNYDMHLQLQNQPGLPQAVNHNRRPTRTFASRRKPKDQNGNHSPNPAPSRIRFFSRTHPSSSGATGTLAVADTSETNAIETSKEPRAAKKSDTSRSPRRSRTRASQKPMMETLKPKSTPERPKPKTSPETPKTNSGGLFSRVAWSLSRSSTNESFVSRLKSLKTSRLLRKKTTIDPSGHQPLGDEDEVVLPELYVGGGETTTSPPMSSRFVANSPQYLYAHHANQIPSQVVPASVKDHSAKKGMDMTSIFPSSQLANAQDDVTHKQMPKHSLNATGIVSNLLKVDDSKLQLMTPIFSPSSDEIRRFVGPPPQPPPPVRPTHVAWQPIQRPSPRPLQVAKPRVNELEIHHSESSPIGTVPTTAFRARYTAAVTRSTTTSVAPPPPRPEQRVRFQPPTTSLPTTAARNSSFATSQKITNNSLLGRRRYHDEEDRESSSSSNSASFGHYLLD